MAAADGAQTNQGRAAGGKTNDTAVRPFSVHFSNEALADLRQRVAATRWPSQELVADDTQGVRLATMRKLADYWAKQYDWRKAEANINQ